MNHLLDRGHKRLLFVGACPGDANTRDRIRGFRLATAARGVLTDESHLIVAPEAEGLDQPHLAALIERLRSPERPTAIFAAGARLALQVVGAARNLGLSVPEDLSVVGYDDPDFLALAYPSMTTVRQPLAEMAAKAVELMFDAARTGDPRPRQEVLAPDLVVRESTAHLSLPHTGDLP